MNEFIIIDIETTGLNAQKCEIMEIGALKVNCKTMEIIDHFEVLINIQGSVPWFISQLTGITKNMLRQNGLSIFMALKKLNDFCGNLNILAHNSSFDQRFIRHYLWLYKIPYIQTHWINTIDIFKRAFPKRKTYKLASLIKDYDLADHEDHRAISDAMHTLSLLKIANFKQ